MVSVPQSGQAWVTPERVALARGGVERRRHLVVIRMRRAATAVTVGIDGRVQLG